MASEFKTKEIRGTRTVGEKLRQARKRQHLSLEEAERDLKIRLKYLEAFEENKYDALPSEVYAIGFLRRYAEYLTLKPEPLISQYKTEYQGLLTKMGKSQTLDFSPASSMPQWQFFITPKTVIIIIIAMVIIGVFGYIWWAVRNFSAPPKLIINEPKTDTVITSDEINIKGETDIGAFVFINKEPVNVSPEGKFEQVATLTEGTNTIVIEAKNRLDRRTIRTIKILSESEAPTPTLSPMLTPGPSLTPSISPGHPTPS